MLPLILLSGGLATRMRPITEKIPKAMIDFNGEPFIHHQLRLLGSKGITHVILCLGFLGEIIEQYVGDGSKYHIKIEYFYDGNRLLGTGGAIKKIDSGLPNDFFILYGDSYLDIYYAIIEKAYLSSKRNGLMTVYRNQDRWDNSNVIFRDGILIKYSKKQKLNEMNYIDYGLGILNKSVFAAFPRDIKFDLAEIYEQLSDENQLMGYEVFERFYEIGSMEGLNTLREKLIRTREESNYE
jgi:NDP-sugar pyrophosphorylase family protein